MPAAPGPPWSAVEYTSTHPHDVRLRPAQAVGNEVGVRYEIVGTGELPLTVNPTHRALIIVCEAFASRSVSLARMSIGTLRCAGIVALAGFKSVWRSDRRDRHCYNR